MMKIKNQEKVESAVKMYKMTKDYKNTKMSSNQDFQNYLTAYFINAFIDKEEKKSNEFKSFQKDFDKLSGLFYKKVDHAVLMNIINIINTPNKESINVNEVEPQKMSKAESMKIKVLESLDPSKSTIVDVAANIVSQATIEKDLDDSENVVKKNKKKAKEARVKKIKKKYKDMNNIEAYSKIISHHFWNGIDTIKEAFGF